MRNSHSFRAATAQRSAVQWVSGSALVAVLAMASTTGGLWLSEDQGDSWQAVSVNLPPVYAVTFA